jgi:3-oxoacyl-[acyl-carrier protein] reductase
VDLGIAGRAAAVAAASSGLGRAAARALAAEGAAVAICGRSEERVREAATAIADETGAEVHPVVADVSDAEQCRRFVSQAAASFGRLDILVTNTGGPRPGGAFEVDEQDWADAWRSTLMNVVALVRAAVPHMRERSWGRIVNVASLSARQPIPGLVLSNAFRPAIAGLARTLADELGPQGILVNTLCPGYTRTPRLEELAAVRAEAAGTSPDAVTASLAASVPLRRIAEPDEFGAVVAFLCSERASYLTGVTLAVDGGASRGLL